MRMPYILYKRPGSPYYYMQAWDGTKYGPPRSTARLLGLLKHPPADARPSRKADADAIARAWIAEGAPQGAGVTAVDYLRAFFAEGGTYAKAREARGVKLSRAYLATGRTALCHHVAPWLEAHGMGSLPLRYLRPMQLEEMLLGLVEAGNTPNRVNEIRRHLSISLDEADRLGLISGNPLERVPAFAHTAPVRTILTVEEAKAFLGVAMDPRLHAMNRLAATTGMRLGECRGLLVSDIGEDRIEVIHNWQEREGNKGPKGSRPGNLRARVVPLPAGTRKELLELVKLSPFGGPFVFWGTVRMRPIPAAVVQTGFRDACLAIGIDEALRKARRLTFHAWRHWYNSMLRGHVPDHALRALTGHRTEAMTDHYTEITEATMEEVRKVSEGLVGDREGVGPKVS